MDKMGKTFLGIIIIHIWCSFTEIFGILLNIHILSAIKLFESESKN